MLIVAVAWIYVVGLMALAEAEKTTIVAGLMTFLFYCVVPVSILYYLFGSKRRADKLREEQRRRTGSTGDAVDALDDADD